MKEVDHFEQRNYPWDIWHTLVVLILKNTLEFILPKITDLICTFSIVVLNYNVTNKSFL